MNNPTPEPAVAELTFREALPPPKLGELRQKLRQKAKQEQRQCFHSLHGDECRSQMLQAAGQAVRRIFPPTK